MKNEIGNKYGRLTVIRRATEEEYPRGKENILCGIVSVIAENILLPKVLHYEMGKKFLAAV